MNRRPARDLPVQALLWAKSHLLVVSVIVGGAVALALYTVPKIAIDRPASVQLTASADPAMDMIIKINTKPVGRAHFSTQTSTQTVRFEGQPIQTVDFVADGPIGARVDLSKVLISYGSTQISRREGLVLDVLQRNGFAKVTVDEAGIHARLSDQEGRISDVPKPPLVVLNKIGAVQRWLLGAAHSPVVPNIWVVGLLLGLATVLLSRLWRPVSVLVIAIGTMLTTWIVAYMLYKIVPDLLDIPPPVSVAVGGSSYFGHPYPAQQVAGVLITLMILVAALVLTLRFKDRLRGDTAVGVTKPGHSILNQTTERKSVIVATWALVSLTLVPTLAADALGPVDPGWDVANLTVWNFFSQHGLVAMKDYWFPYGFQWVFSQVPLGQLWGWLMNIAMLGLFAWSMWRLSDRRTWRVVACIAAIALLSALGGGLWRYFPAVLMGTTYAAIGPAQFPRPTKAHLIFFVATLLALLMEPDLLAFGLAGAAFVAFGELLFGRLHGHPLAVIRNFLVDTIPVVASLTIVFVLWVVLGTSEGNIEFFGHLTDTSAYVGSDQSVDGLLSQISLIPTANSLVTSLPFLVLVAGLLLGFFARDSAAIGASRLLLAIAGASIVFLGRGLARPNDLLYYLPLVGLCCAAILLWERQSLRSVVLSAAFAGSVLTGLQYNDGLQTYLAGAANSPIRAINSGIFVSSPDAVKFARDETYNHRRFERWPDLTYARELISISGNNRPSFAVLGDVAILYLWFDQRPPYHINLYDASPIRMQREMIRRLEKQRPKYMVWKQEAAGVDGTPYTVRNPLIYAYTIQNYIPSRQNWRKCKPQPAYCASADILVRRPSTTPIPIDFWTKRLGNKIDLGFVPSYAELPQSCKRNDCTDYAVIQGKAINDGLVTVKLSNHGSRYFATVKTRPDISSYTIRLDRLWFWPLLGSDAQLSINKPGWSVEVRHGKSNNRLY